MRLFRRGFFTFVTIVAAYLGWCFVYGYWSERSGPFAYFQNAPGEGTIQERGERQIAAKLRIGADAEEAARFLMDAGFKCMKVSAWRGKPIPSNMAPTEGEKLPQGAMKPKDRLSLTWGCIWRFGFADNWWHNSFTADENGRIVRSFHRVTDGPDV